MPEVVSEETFTVSVTGAGVEIKREVSAAKLALVMNVIMGSGSPEEIATQGSNITGFSRPEKISLREFLDNAKAATKPDQIVAIGQYMALYEDKDTFSREEIKARFQAARERLPSNMPRDFSTAIGKSLIAQDHSDNSRYYVTKTGAQAVERRFGAKN